MEKNMKGHIFCGTTHRRNYYRESLLSDNRNGSGQVQYGFLGYD